MIVTRAFHLLLRKTMILMVLLTLAIAESSAQEYASSGMFMLSNINTDNGLQSSRVYSVLQSSDRAMWIATRRGVDRYNGSVVKNYSLPRKYVYADASGRIVKLVTTHQGALMAYDNKGYVYQFDRSTDSFRNILTLSNFMQGSIFVNEVVPDADGSLWIAMNRGLYHTTPGNKGAFIKTGICVYHLAKIGNQLLVCSNKGVALYSLSTGKYSSLMQGVSVLSSYYDARSCKLWMGTFHSGVIVFDWNRKQQLHVPSLDVIPTIPVRAIRKLNDATLLFGVDGGGIYAYNTVEQSASLLLDSGGKPDKSLMGNGIYDLCVDNFGNIWSGSYTGGVDLAVPVRNMMQYVTHEYLNPQSLIDNNVNALLESSDGKMWYATDKGVSIYDEHTHHWTHGLQGRVALTLCEVERGKILVGTYGNGIYQMTANGAATSVYSTTSGNIKSDYVYSVFRDSGGALWVGCLDGALTHICNGKSLHLPILEVQSIAESPDGKRIAIGTSHGGYLVEKHTHRISRFFYTGQFKNNDYNYFINALQFKDNATVEIATDGGGIYIYDLKKNTVKNYTKHDALPSNVVYAMKNDYRGRLWLSTDKGLAFIYNNKVVNLNIFKGFDFEYRRMSALRTKSGKMVFGGSNGAVIIADNIIEGLNYTAPLRITEVDMDGVDCDSIWQQRICKMLGKGELRLEYSENTPIIKFESINYKYQHDIVYQYFLDGYDRQWSTPSKMQSARYVYLAPGHYIFHVRSISKSDGRLLGEQTLHIYISQPWWKSFWAYLLYLAIIGTIAYFGWRYYKQQLQKKYYDEKINFFVNTAHNIRTPLSLVLAPLRDLAAEKQLTDRARGFLEMAQKNGDKLLRMITELLDFQRTEQGLDSVNYRAVDISVLLRGELDKFAAMAAEKNIQLKLTACPEIKVMADISIMDLIFENLISNAVKYTPEGGNVVMWAAATEKELKIFVNDNGIGIPNSEKNRIFQSFFRASNAVNSQEMGSGLGLMLTQQLVTRLKGDLSFKSEENRGTTFTVTLPRLAAEDNDADHTASTVTQPNATATVATTHTATEVATDETNGKDTLLFVDDNEDLRMYMKMAFSNRYELVLAASAEEALEYLNGGECDIVVSDIMMPGIQGDELCRRLKENADTSWLPVILLTAKAGRDFMIDGLNIGADDYIAKPFDSEVLASKIDSILNNRRRLSKYFMQRSLAIVRGEKTTDTAALTSGGEVATQEAATESAPPIDEKAQAFVEKATRLVLDNLKDTDFNIDRLCSEMMMSRTLFYGKLKNFTGQTPQDFIRLIRLEQAAQYIKQGDSILDVSLKTGFTNVKYFSTVFKKHFGVSPSKYQ